MPEAELGARGTDPESGEVAAAAIPIEGYLRAIRAHPRIFVVIVVVAVLGSGAWLALRPSNYEATADLLITPVPDSDESLAGLPLVHSSGADPARAINTAAAMVESGAVLRRASSNLGGELGPAAVDAAIEIEPSETENIVAVRAAADNAERAAEIANAYADAVIETRRAQLQPLVREAIDQAESELAALPDSDSARADVLQARIADLNGISDGTDPTISIVTEAAPPSSRSGTDSRIVLAFALLAGLAIAATTVVLIELLVPGAIKDEAQLRGVYPLPILARVPGVSQRALSSSGGWPSVEFKEAFRTLRSQLEFRVNGDRRRGRAGAGSPDSPAAVAIVSASTGDGKTTVALDLGKVVAETGRSTLVIEMDVREPELAMRLEVEAGDDVTRALRSDADLAAAVTRVPGFSELRVIPAPSVDNARVIEAISAAGPELVRGARRQVDYVVVDTAALGEVSDSMSVLAEVDEIVVVVRYGHTRRAALDGLRSALDRAGVTPAGMLVIGADRGGPARPGSARMRARRTLSRST